jgi:DNA-binding CsgD family transcriptional regulator
MQSVPLRVLEGEVRVWSDRFDLRDDDPYMSLSFAGVPPDWAEIHNLGLTIMCKATDQPIAVRMEAWMDEPSGHEEQWDERIEILIDWTSGSVSLDPDLEGGRELAFSFGPSALSTAYRLRISRRWQPMSKGATGNAAQEDQGLLHHQERYLFQFWPVPATRDVADDESDIELADSLSSREKTILASMARGISDVAIAKDLKLPLRAVKTSIASIYHKLETNDRTAAVVHALRRGWISME